MLQAKQVVKELCCRLSQYPKEFHLPAVEFQGIRQAEGMSVPIQFQRMLAEH